LEKKGRKKKGKNQVWGQRGVGGQSKKGAGPKIDHIRIGGKKRRGQKEGRLVKPQNVTSTDIRNVNENLGAKGIGQRCGGQRIQKLSRYPKNESCRSLETNSGELSV